MNEEKNLDNIKAGFIWNSIAGIINAAEAVIILMVLKWRVLLLLPFLLVIWR